jgi:hypothetical protein
MWIRGKKILGAAMNVGKVAAAATGDENLLAQAVCMVEQRHSAPTLPGLNGAHQAGCASTKN